MRQEIRKIQLIEGFLDEEEKRRAELAAFAGVSFEPVLQGKLAWDAWASPEHIEGGRAEELIQHVRGRLLPGLAITLIQIHMAG